MVLQGRSSTLPVTLEDMAYHVRCVAAGNRTAFVIGDLPFGSYQQSREQAMASATTLMQAGAQMVKLEGGGWTPETVRFLTERGVPVCAHPRANPQSVHALGGYRIQGKTEEAAATPKSACPGARRRRGCAAGAGADSVGARSRSHRDAANPDHRHRCGCGLLRQVLVLHDMLGITRGKLPRFVKNFMAAMTASRMRSAVTLLK